ncbi:hypothetical protein PHLGIDRAFT_418610 [Phlebiopsis gigantea 11061_1 CR5-6]|uniref:Glycoside hydrolase family 76 protein n=1 Tax=Phlebiopsis gigantea (strain 11061_1 CR5-6) TaxID=745531 RepID=A0A0C3S6K6_PHLG1|nr:hypothetical protein PHLGIDRAFT_418610 [Phlebiopsis gigantea 11061_1 CR5-6]
MDRLGRDIFRRRSDLPDTYWWQESRAYLFRGLYSSWNRTGKRSAMTDFIEAYFNRQFYALQDLASLPGSNIYNTNWHGPALSEFNGAGQVGAAYVMNAVADIARRLGSDTSPGQQALTSSSALTATTATPSSHAKQSTSPSKGSPSKTPATIIAGCAVIGVVLASIAMGYLVTLFRKRRRAGQEQNAREQLEAQAIPYDAQVSQMASSDNLILAPRKTAFLPRPRPPRATITSAPLSFTPPTESEATPNLTAVPAPLWYILNYILSRLPRGTDEEPPEYYHG